MDLKRLAELLSKTSTFSSPSKPSINPPGPRSGDCIAHHVQRKHLRIKGEILPFCTPRDFAHCLWISMLHAVNLHVSSSNLEEEHTIRFTCGPGLYRALLESFLKGKLEFFSKRDRVEASHFLKNWSLSVSCLEDHHVLKNLNQELGTQTARRFLLVSLRWSTVWTAWWLASSLIWRLQKLKVSKAWIRPGQRWMENFIQCLHCGDETPNLDVCLFLPGHACTAHILTHACLHVYSRHTYINRYRETCKRYTEICLSTQIRALYTWQDIRFRFYATAFSYSYIKTLILHLWMELSFLFCDNSCEASWCPTDHFKNHRIWIGAATIDIHFPFTNQTYQTILDAWNSCCLGWSLQIFKWIAPKVLYKGASGSAGAGSLAETGMGWKSNLGHILLTGIWTCKCPLICM